MQDLGILHGWLKTHTTYDEHTAWAQHSTTLGTGRVDIVLRNGLDLGR